MATLPISLDRSTIDQIAQEFDLRTPNKEGLRQLIFHLTRQSAGACGWPEHEFVRLGVRCSRWCGWRFGWR